MIIGITGTIGAGKGTVVEYLKSKGYSHYSISHVLRAMLASQGKHQGRSEMSHLAEELLHQRPGGVFSIVLEHAKHDGATDFIVEAVHRESEAAFLRAHGAKIIGVDAPLEVRYERTHERAEGEKDAVTLEQFTEHSLREDEGKGDISSNIRAVINSADAVISNNSTVEHLHTQINSVLAKLTS